MSNQQILAKAIKRAAENGFNEDNCMADGLHHPLELIYNHDFAKALWGDEATYDMTHIVQPDNTYKMNVRPAWQYHLQNMVIADDPIKYLGENI